MKYNTFTFYRQRDRLQRGSQALKDEAWSRMQAELERQGAEATGGPKFRWEWALKVSVETDKEPQP